MTWTVQQQEASGSGTLQQLSAFVARVDDVQGLVDLVTIPYWPLSQSPAETWTVIQQEE